MAKAIAKFSSLAALTMLVQTVLTRTAIAQAEQPPLPTDPSDPLISRGGNIAIHIGLVLLALAVGFALKSLSSKLERVLLLAFTMAVIFIVVLWYL